MNFKFIAALVAAIALCATTARAQSQTDVSTIHVDVTTGHEINSFDPDEAMGSSIDALSHFSIDKVYTPHIIQESLSAGWGPISYRNNTELRMAAQEAWSVPSGGPSGATSTLSRIAGADTIPRGSGIHSLLNGTMARTRSTGSPSRDGRTVRWE